MNTIFGRLAVSAPRVAEGHPQLSPTAVMESTTICFKKTNRKVSVLAMGENANLDCVNKCPTGDCGGAAAIFAEKLANVKPRNPKPGDGGPR